MTLAQRVLETASRLVRPGGLLRRGGDRPTISLNLSCYNQERFVGEAVDAALAQTYEPLQILILDDCSTDGTAAVIEERLARRRTRHAVRFVRNERNLGTRANGQLGLSLTSSPFVVIAGGDDILHPELVSEMVRVWREQDVSLVIANAEYIDEHSRPLGRLYRDPKAVPNDGFEAMARDGVNDCCFGPCIGLERALYDTFGWPPIELEVVDIMVVFYAYLLKGAKFIPRPLLKYRVHDANSSHSLQAERLSGIERLAADEQMYYLHLAHAVYARDLMTRLSVEQPEPYGGMRLGIGPLLDVQVSECARKFAEARAALETARRPTRGR